MRYPLSAFVVVLLTTVISHGAEAPPLQVRTESGIVAGKAEGTVSAFLGIPYAAPPVGPLRWKPPQPVTPWPGVRPATEFGHRPMQAQLFADMVFRDPGASEDCLTLNVWVPPHAAKARKKLPVMVWIYGGGFAAGATSEQRQDGSLLATKGVIVVSMNYRLGVFGFMVHPELIAESPHHAAGNYGLLDQLAALSWVHRNIAAFGGDPANVTLFGESAGSMSVSAQMCSPLARRLFQRAIGESGAAFGRTGLAPKSAAERAQTDRQYVEDRVGRSSLADLRAVPAEALLDAVAKRPQTPEYRFGPVVDGYFLPDSPHAIFAAHRQNDVPLLAGWNRDEGGKKFEKYPPTAEGLRQLAAAEFPGNEDNFLQVYPSFNAAAAARSSADFASDHFIVYGTWRWLEAQVANGHSPVYHYVFDRAPPGNFFGKPSGSFHSGEIIYVFGQFAAHSRVAWTPADRALSDLMQTYWTNFAKRGDPNGAGLPVWPRYQPTAWPVLHLDTATAARPDEHRARYLFLDQTWSG